MRCLSSALLALLMLAVVSQPGLADARWTRLRTPHFLVDGDVSPGRLREAALRFEQFRQVVHRVLPNARLEAPVPMTITVFAHKQDLQKAAPLPGQAGRSQRVLRDRARSHRHSDVSFRPAGDGAQSAASTEGTAVAIEFLPDPQE